MTPSLHTHLVACLGPTCLDQVGPFGDSPGDSPQISRSKGPVIEEIHTDDDEEGGDAKVAGEKKDKGQKNPDSSKDPLVEHPDDQAVDEREDKVAPLMDWCWKRANKQIEQRVKQHIGSPEEYMTRAIQLQGSLIQDGKVDTMQKLHNLSEDELAGFEQAWKGNAEGHLPSWNDEFNFQGNAGASGSGQSRHWGGWALPLGERSGPGRAAGGMRPDNESMTYSSGGRPKKVVTINIE
ncbi:hypothetical protein F0562_019108 [Nyssa sinensis]|uniref:Uncharacterized protein n=1 Tax=Nyssa sinensis TaxID=561372 RepID=A0A5J4ZDC9_9ASTE|nr:hypothetical protein F0562_019108 [Nyssa sinensis]